MNEKIKVAIIDDNKEYLELLEESLSFYNDIEVKGTATKYKQAKSLLLNEKPELVFLDIEMPCKNGFELLDELREKGCRFSVIFYTSYDKYMIQALRESAFDFIVKPYEEKELKTILDRYKEQRNQQADNTPPPLYVGQKGEPSIIALPSLTGLKFIDKNQILLFRCIKQTDLKKPCWEALLTNLETIRLGNSVTANKIQKLLTGSNYHRVNQSCILNFNYLNMLEYQTRSCVLLPPFDKMEIIASRSQMKELREMFDVF